MIRLTDYLTKSGSQLREVNQKQVADITPPGWGGPPRGGPPFEPAGSILSGA